MIEKKTEDQEENLLEQKKDNILFTFLLVMKKKFKYLVFLMHLIFLY